MDWRDFNIECRKMRASFSIMTDIGDCAKLLRVNGDGINVRHSGYGDNE